MIVNMENLQLPKIIMFLSLNLPPNLVRLK
jgi:hypothetical protein